MTSGLALQIPHICRYVRCVVLDTREGVLRPEGPIHDHFDRMDTVKTGDPISIHEDGTVEVG